MSLGTPSRVRILFDDGVCEEVAVSFVGECLCRLEETPMASTTEARFGDVLEFEPEDGIAKMRRVVQGSPLVTLTRAVSERVADTEAFRGFLADVESRGGRIERAHGGAVLAHVRPDMVSEVESALDELTGRGSGTQV